MISRRGVLRNLRVLAGWPIAAALQLHPQFSARTEFVVLHVTVKDRKGGYVTGLAQEAFHVFENGRRQEIRLFSSEDAPITVALLVDGSGSMQTNRAGVIAAAEAFAEASHPADEMAALVFDDTVHATLPSSSPFTNQGSVLRDGLLNALHARGRTALLDGISAGLQYVDRGRYVRKVLVLVSDGGDNASVKSFAEVLTEVKASNTVIYTVALVDPVEPDANPRRLGQIAEASGGVAFVPSDVGQIAAILKDIARDIRNTYTVAYTPGQPAMDGEFRGVNVVVQAPRGQSLVVRSRRGYQAGSTS